MRNNSRPGDSMIRSMFQGGLKAVVWTDALQLILLCLAYIFVIILGIIRVGGIGTVWERSLAGGRINFFE